MAEIFRKAAVVQENLIYLAEQIVCCRLMRLVNVFFIYFRHETLTKAPVNGVLS